MGTNSELAKPAAFVNIWMAWMRAVGTAPSPPDGRTG
jgi:hypothetical protein